MIHGGFWSAVARKIYRTQDESRRLHSVRDGAAKYVVALALLGTLAFTLAPPILELASEWASTSAVVPIPNEAWRVYLGTAKMPCGYDAATSADCPANPGFSKLWKSALSRADADHDKRIQERAEREFWIGAEIPVAGLRKAAAARANALMLGWIRSTFHVWVDGKLIASGNRTTSEEIMVTVPISRLLEPRPLSIAIQIVNDSEHPKPDLLTQGRPTLGLLTTHAAAGETTRRTFIDKVRPLAMVLTNLFVAFIFSLAWVSARQKQEYFYMSLFAVSSAASYVGFVDTVVFALTPRAIFALYLYTNFLKGAFTMFVGFAFARIRPAAFRIGIPLTFAIPIAMISYLKDPIPLYEFRHVLSLWIVPLFCAVGAGSCLMQAAYLEHAGRTGSSNPVRIRRLLLFGLGIVAIGFLIWANSTLVISFTKHNYWYRFIDLVLVFLLGLVVFAEYREHERQAGRTPVSEYHRRPVLPEKISGAMLAADFKNSEPFYQHRATQGLLDDPMGIWRAQFYGAVARHGGVVLRRKGDEIAAFFDDEHCDDPAAAALAAADDMAHASERLGDEYRKQGLYPKNARGFHFRASVVEGEIKPVWEQVGSVREPAWVETGPVATFVLSSRLLELERLIGLAERTVLVLPETLAGRLAAKQPGLCPKFITRGRRLEDKHGNVYEIAGYSPDATEAQLQNAA